MESHGLVFSSFSCLLHLIFLIWEDNFLNVNLLIVPGIRVRLFLKELAVVFRILEFAYLILCDPFLLIKVINVFHMIMAFGGLCFGVSFEGDETWLDPEKVNDVSSQKTYEKKVNEEKDIKLFVVVEEFNDVHDELRGWHEFGGITYNLEMINYNLVWELFACSF